VNLSIEDRTDILIGALALVAAVTLAIVFYMDNAARKNSGPWSCSVYRQIEDHWVAYGWSKERVAAHTRRAARGDVEISPYYQSMHQYFVDNCI